MERATALEQGIFWRLGGTQAAAEVQLQYECWLLRTRQPNICSLSSDLAQTNKAPVCRADKNSLPYWLPTVCLYFGICPQGYGVGVRYVILAEPLVLDAPGQQLAQHTVMLWACS